MGRKYNPLITLIKEDFLNINQQSRNNTALKSYTSNSERTTKQPKNGFYELGIAPSLIKAINRLKFEAPTPIQQEAIPVGIQGDDIIALAQTGSGKTLAFGIPMLQRLSKSKKGIGLVFSSYPRIGNSSGRITKNY